MKEERAKVLIRMPESMRERIDKCHDVFSRRATEELGSLAVKLGYRARLSRNDVIVALLEDALRVFENDHGHRDG